MTKDVPCNGDKSNGVVKVSRYNWYAHTDEDSLMNSWNVAYSTAVAPGDQFFKYK